jgi:hypothetical protein
MIEGHEIIHGEVPYHYYAYCHEFGYVEIELDTISEDVDQAAGNEKACGHDTGELDCLHQYLRILTTPGPKAI